MSASALEAEVIRAEELLRTAMLTSDVTMLETLIAPELVFTNQNGAVFGREEDLALHRSGVLVLRALEPSERLLRIDDGVAVVSVRVDLSGSYAGSPFQADLRFTRVWRRSDDGNWHIIAGHSSVVQT